VQYQEKEELFWKLEKFKFMKTKIYNQKGKEVSEIDLREDIFGLDWNADLVSQVIYVQRMNQRAGTAHTKDRGEVAGSNQKPWQQKGLGRARHGSKRSPLWRHGGVTHGPTNQKNYKKDLPRTMKAQALLTLLSAKFKDNKILFLDSLSVENGKTKEAEEIMTNLSKITNFENLIFPKKNNVYLTNSKLNVKSKNAFRNLPYVSAHNVEDLNPSTLANTRYLILTDIDETINYLANKIDKSEIKNEAKNETKDESEKKIKSKVKKIASKKVATKSVKKVVKLKN